MHVGEGVPYYVHSSYNVENADGRTVRWVPNHVGDMDETPQLVPLATGIYQVVAESADYGQVRIQALIQAGQTTKLHLEGNGSWKPQTPAAQNNGLVRFPDGEPVGWRALVRD